MENCVLSYFFTSRFFFFVRFFVCPAPSSTSALCPRASVLTHQVHPGCSVAQRHADPGGRVSDDLMTHVTLTFLLSSAPTRGCCPSIRPSVHLPLSFHFRCFRFTCQHPTMSLTLWVCGWACGAEDCSVTVTPTVGPRPDQAGWSVSLFWKYQKGKTDRTQFSSACLSFFF